MGEYEDFIASESRKWLEHVRTLKGRIKTCDDMMEVVRRLAEPKGIDYSKQPGGQSNKDAIADVVAAMDELTEAWRTERIRLTAELGEATSTIAKLDDAAQRTILLARYVDCLEWSDVASIAGYSEDHCYRVHRAALASLHRFIPPDWRTELPRAT